MVSRRFVVLFHISFLCHLATREWDSYETVRMRKGAQGLLTSEEIALRKSKAILEEMELEVDRRKYGYKRFGASKKPLFPIQKLSTPEKEALM